MRKAALAVLVFVACGFATNAQLSVSPRVGIEQAFNCVKYNNTSCINPISPNISPQISVRADYLFNKVHGPFVGIASNRSLVTYEFTNPETGDKEYAASQGDWKLRLEAGYQVSSKPIALGKTANQPATTVSTANLSPCAAARLRAMTPVPQKPVMTMRIQPYAGMAFVPNPEQAVTTAIKNGETVYQYQAGNYTSAFITGLNLAFAKGSVNKYVVGIQYLKGIGMNTETLNTSTQNKLVTTQLSSSSAAWNINVGIPLSFAKNKQPAAAPNKVVVPAKAVAPAKAETPKTAETAPVKKSCGYYRSRCSHGLNWD